jgi:hypothetical protein
MLAYHNEDAIQMYLELWVTNSQLAESV